MIEYSYECHSCNKLCTMSMPTRICCDCFLRKLNLSETPVNWWKEAKLYSYWVLLFFPLSCFIACKWGLKVQWLFLAAFIYGQVMPGIARWLTKKF